MTPRSAIRDVIEGRIARGDAPGAVALTGVGDEAQLVVAGRQACERSAPMRRDCIFQICSMTKPVTAVIALMLIEEGLLRLDEPIERLLPELRERRVLRKPDASLEDTVPAARPITVADLLTFRLGLGILWDTPNHSPIQEQIAKLGLVGFGPPDPLTPLGPDEWTRRLGTLPLIAQPGEEWLYNTGSYVLGVLIARAAGRPLPEVMRQRLFEPLGMKDTGFCVPEDKLDRLVSCYRPQGEDLILYDEPGSSIWRTVPAFPDGGAGLLSTADDFFAFSRLLLGRGQVNGQRLLSESAVASITTDQLTGPQSARGADILGRGRGWGYGLSVVRDSVAAALPLGSFGWNGGYGTTWVADPESGTTAILLTQVMFSSPTPPAIHREFWRAVF
jgi:CubicO group peptidase (beta-lactamase class C family)